MSGAGELQADKTSHRWHPLRDIRNAFGFFTVLPLSRAGSIGEIAASSYLLPVVAAFLGALEGAAGWGSFRLFGAPVAAALTLTAALLLTGLHHSDGLADFGDALMVHGNTARRIEVLKDRTMGIGAAGALLLTYLVSWAALTEIISLRPGAGLMLCLMASEIPARLCLLLVGMLGRPSHQGSGSIFIHTLKGWRGVAGILLSLVIMALLAIFMLPLAVILAGAAAIVTSMALLTVSWRFFGGVGGDVLGASVELGRLAALLGLLAGLSR